MLTFVNAAGNHFPGELVFPRVKVNLVEDRLPLQPLNIGMIHAFRSMNEFKIR